jgi:hypothetical protein
MKLRAFVVGSVVAGLVLAGLVDVARAGGATTREAGLLEVGPERVGYTSFSLRDSTRANREVHLMVWYPTDDAGDAPVAVYDQVLGAPAVLADPKTGLGMCLPTAAPYLPSASLCTLCLPPVPPATACSAKMTFDAEQYAASVEAVAGGDFPMVREGVAVAPGGHPLVLHLPGGGGPGSAFVYEAVKYASHGFIYVSVTHLGNNRRQLVLDAELVLEALLEWNEAAGHPLLGAIEPTQIFGAGHSLGGRTWLALTSAAPITDPASPELGLTFLPERRVRGIAVQDATREVLVAAQEPSWKAQLEGNDSDVFLNSQECRPTQIALQQDLGGSPQRLDLVGVCPNADALNHTLFGQLCLLVNAHVIANNPTIAFSKDGGAPIDLVARCTEPNAPLQCSFVAEVKPEVAEYRAREIFFARQTSKFNIAYFKTLMQDNQYRVLFAPGQVLDDDGVELINTSLGEGGDETTVTTTQVVGGAEGFCAQPGGADHGDFPIFTSDVP